MKRRLDTMKSKLLVAAAVAFGLALVGCGQETPKPPPPKTVVTPGT